MTVFGTRPEAIKMAPLVKALEYDAELEPMIVVTAQHREMLDSVLHTFNIKPHYDLNIMKEGQTLSDITSRAMTKLEDVIKRETRYGISSWRHNYNIFWCSCCFYNKVAIGHVEAGLRTRHKYAPFPEEVNRQMVSNLADLHFAPTKGAANNLLQENKSPDSIIITGNTAIDTLELTIQKEYTSDIIRKHQGKRIILLTVHRRENVGQPMINIYKAMRKIVDEYEDIVIVSPLHLNPKVRELAYEYLGEHERIELIEPLDVVDFHNFANKAYLILTDSGGIQEEAPSLNKPVLVLRDVTERPEGVTAGTLKVVGTDFDNVLNQQQKS